MGFCALHHHVLDFLTHGSCIQRIVGNLVNDNSESFVGQVEFLGNSSSDEMQIGVLQLAFFETFLGDDLDVVFADFVGKTDAYDSAWNEDFDYFLNLGTQDTMVDNLYESFRIDYYIALTSKKIF